MNLKSIILVGSIIILQNVAFGQITFGTGLRYQLDHRKKGIESSSTILPENSGVHLVPNLELEIHQESFVVQFGLGYYQGGGRITKHGGSMGGHTFFNPPPYHLYSTTMSYIHEYSYLTTRIAICGRIMRQSKFNLDLGLFFATDFLVNENKRQHSAERVDYTMAYTDTSGTYHPQTNDKVTTSNDPFSLVRYEERFSYIGVRITPQVKLSQHFVLGVELNMKCQWKSRLVGNATSFDHIAFDFAIRFGYSFGKRAKAN